MRRQNHHLYHLTILSHHHPYHLHRQKEKIIDEIDTYEIAIYEIPDPRKIELRDPLLYVLTTKADDVLADDYVNDKAIEEKAI